MEHYNFDEIIERRHTNCAKYDGCQEVFGDSGLLPLWVADMDFRTPSFVIDAIEKRMKHPILGYFTHPEDVFKSITHWMIKRHGWRIEKEWIYMAGGTMSSIHFLIQSYTSVSDRILIQTPVYSPFYSVIENQGRVIVRNPLILHGDHYEMDLQDLEKSLKEGIKLMILCNPHNPIGRCWSKDELSRLGELCLKYKCIIISDENHSDVIMPGYKHTPMASISADISQLVITCMSPSKAFNVAGLSTSVIIISNHIMREKFERYKHGTHFFAGNIFGEVALTACYNDGEEWLTQLLDYIKGNVVYVQTFLEKNVPGIRPYRHEATYLLWLDFSAMGLSHETVYYLLVEKAKLALSDGIAFGDGGDLHFRINVACTRATLKEAMERIKRVFCSYC